MRFGHRTARSLAPRPAVTGKTAPDSCQSDPRQAGYQGHWSQRLPCVCPSILSVCPSVLSVQSVLAGRQVVFHNLWLSNSCSAESREPPGLEPGPAFWSRPLREALSAQRGGRSCHVCEAMCGPRAVPAGALSTLRAVVCPAPLHDAGEPVHRWVTCPQRPGTTQCWMLALASSLASMLGAVATAPQAGRVGGYCSCSGCPGPDVVLCCPCPLCCLSGVGVCCSGSNHCLLLTEQPRTPPGGLLSLQVSSVKPQAGGPLCYAFSARPSLLAGSAQHGPSQHVLCGTDPRLSSRDRRQPLCVPPEPMVQCHRQCFIRLLMFLCEASAGHCR